MGLWDQTAIYPASKGPVVMPAAPQRHQKDQFVQVSGLCGGGMDSTTLEMAF